MVLTSLGGENINALPLEAGAMLAFATTAWIAIRRYGLFDTRRVLTRGLVYGGLSACVIGVYLAVVAGLGRLAADAVSGPAAVVIAALIALPLRDMLQRQANRLVYGYRDDPYGALVRLGQRLADAAASADVLPAVVHTVREALRLPYVAVVRGDQTEAVAGTPGHGQREEFALVFANETIGTLIAEARVEEPLTAAERELLAGIARQLVAAAHAVSLTTDLLRSRERLVAGTEEERQRLRRDLHDGLGPALAGVVLWGYSSPKAGLPRNPNRWASGWMCSPPRPSRRWPRCAGSSMACARPPSTSWGWSVPSPNRHGGSVRSPCTDRAHRSRSQQRWRWPPTVSRWRR
jgi:two-component system, NarL family, sensor kinase